jgi:tRNA A37 threonylcarbamoyladenosine biosynthesis protein TsaE
VFEDKDLQKLSVNAFIGMMGKRENSFIEHRVCVNDNLEDFDYAYTQFQKPFVNEINETYSTITSKTEIDKLENAYPVYAQILDCEAIELYKMVKLVKQNKGIPVCVKTDAVVYYATKALDVSKYFWAEDVAKYKHEEFPNLLKRSIEYFHEDKFEIKSMQYNIIEDTNEFNFNIDVAKQIIDSNQGFFLNGAAGTGKTRLQNEIVKLINDNTKIKKMAPTNVAAYLINSKTINNLIHTYLNNSKGLKKFKSIDYIFIDEVSMMKELFYSIFLSIKYLNLHIKFIISGDFAQLAPVNDRYNFNYEHSRALYELVDGNQLNLTFCRRTTKDGQKLFKL